MAARENGTATKALRKAGVFTDPRSYQDFKGRHVLFGKDVTRRREEVFERDRGTCQGCGIKLTWESSDMDHIKPKSKGIDDRIENLQLLGKWCGCHTNGKHAKHGGVKHAD